jgi:hypothetical protein
VSVSNNARERRRGATEWLIAACGIWQVGLGLYFVLVRPAFLPEDLRYVGTDLADVHALAPGLERWLALVFTVMGGFMAGTGFLLAFLGWVVMPRRLRGTTFVLIVAGLCTLVLMSAVNFVLDSAFRWLLVVPAVVWALAVLLYARRTELRS